MSHLGRERMNCTSQKWKEKTENVEVCRNCLLFLMIRKKKKKIITFLPFSIILNSFDIFIDIDICVEKLRVEVVLEGCMRCREIQI